MSDKDTNESGLQRYTGIKKYGKKGFEELQKAGREGASEEEKGAIKDKYLKKKTNEGLGDMAHMAERDHEVQMARAELYKIAKYAIKLHEMLKGVSEAEGIEGWMQSKITKAADYMGSVYHTLEYDMLSANESKKFRGTMAEDAKDEYKNTLAERMSQKKTELSELDADTYYKYWGKAYDDVSDPDGKDPEKLKKRRAFMKKAAAQHNAKKGWERPQGAKKDAGDASKSAAALAKHLAKKDRQAAKAEESLDEKAHKIAKAVKGESVTEAAYHTPRFAFINDDDEIEIWNNIAKRHIRSIPMQNKQSAIRRLKQANYEASLDTFKGYQMWYMNTEAGVRFSDYDPELEEKAKSKAQQRFMGMVHATQKGEPAPSKEVAKVAKSMPKKAAKDYAQTKHKGKPEHVKKK